MSNRLYSNSMTPQQKRRLEESAIRFLWRRLSSWLYPARTVGIPPIPGKTAKDGITISTELALPLADRLRALFCSRLHIVVMISCEESPVSAVANINYNLLPPFTPQREDKAQNNQPELPLEPKKQNP